MLQTLRTTLLAVASLVLSAGTANSQEYGYLDALFPGCSVERCVVKDNPGGWGYQFRSAKKELLQRGIRHVVLDGTCGSWCASVMDTLRMEGVDVCMSPVAELAFHKGTLYKTDKEGNLMKDGNDQGIVKRYFDLPQTKRVRTWIKKHGGVPNTDLSGLMLVLEPADRLFRICGPKDLR